MIFTIFWIAQKESEQKKKPDLMHEHINLWQVKLQLMKIKDVVNI